MANLFHVRAKGKWKTVEVDSSLLSQKEFDNFGCLQVLTDYEIVTKTPNSGKTVGSKKKAARSKTAKSTDNGLESEQNASFKIDVAFPAEIRGSGVSRSTEEPQEKKEKKKHLKPTAESNHAESHECKAENGGKEELRKGKKRKGKKEKISSVKKKAKVSAIVQEHNSSTASITDTTFLSKSQKDMSAWDHLFVPSPVLRSLDEMNFTAPTAIQAMALPHAIRDRLDIVGAAETGSGKTLAFGIPLIHHILRLKDAADPDQESSCDMTDELSGEKEPQLDDDQEDDHDRPPEEEELVDSEGNELGCVRVVHDVDMNTITPVRQKPKQLLSLILTPTRELAIQVKAHLQSAAKYTDIMIAVVVGGMATQKQERLLKKCPEIVVATPGRLWELIQQGEPYLSTVADVKYLVIDEADRMIEKGHFEELSKLLELINTDEVKKKRRQTFVFSATLTMIHGGPQRSLTKKKKSLTMKQKLEALMSAIGIKQHPKIIDLTTKVGTAELLSEARIHCNTDEKDLYLYYFLLQYPGRTLVFANSKDCIRRLVSIFTLLQCKPMSLHADMHQKQRLQNLEKFTDNPRGVLLATDVAARGLDIPNVQHVLHYQVPHTVENYVHRSGRTARANKEGLSVVLIGPDDLRNYRKIVNSLNRNEDLPMFPIDQQYLPVVKSRMALARQIDTLEHRFNKKKHQNDWFLKAASDMDMILDDEQLMHDMGDNYLQSQHRQQTKMLRAQLKASLQQSLTPRVFSGKYPTKTGQLVMPYQPDHISNAVDHLKDEKAKMSKKSILTEHLSASKTKRKRKKSKKHK